MKRAVLGTGYVCALSVDAGHLLLLSLSFITFLSLSLSLSFWQMAILHPHSLCALLSCPRLRRWCPLRLLPATVGLSWLYRYGLSVRIPAC